MKTNYQQIGSDVGELVQKKNVAYGDSIATSAEALKLLYPNGMKPEQYLDGILAARRFDKESRIAQGGADDEDPRLDIAGYAIYGVAVRRSDISKTDSNHRAEARPALIKWAEDLPLVQSAAEVATIKCRLLDQVTAKAARANRRSCCAQCFMPGYSLSHEFPFMGSEARGPYLFCGSFCIEAFKSILVELFASPFEDLHAKLQGKETAPCHSVSANDAEPSSTTKADSASHPDDASPKTTTIESGKSGKPSGGALHSALPSSFASTAAPAATVTVAASKSPGLRDEEQAALVCRARNRNAHNCCGFCGVKAVRSVYFLSTIQDVWFCQTICQIRFLEDWKR